MSENSDLLRGAFDAWNREDLDGWLANTDPGIEFHTAGVFPDFDPVYRGHDGLSRFWTAMREPWAEIQADIEDLEERGDELVFSMRFRARGHSGAEVDLLLFTGIRIRQGLAAQMITKTSAEDAWRALEGLPEPG